MERSDFIKQYSANPEALKELLEECIEVNPQCAVDIIRSVSKYTQEDSNNRSLFVMLEDNETITCQITGSNIHLMQSFLNVLDAQPDFFFFLKGVVDYFETMHKKKKSSKPLS